MKEFYESTGFIVSFLIMTMIINMAFGNQVTDMFLILVLFSMAILNADSFIAGILNRVPEITLFLNPLTNSYERFGSHSAPKYVTWSPQNRSQLIRIPAASGKYSRIELRSPDPSCNPYLVFALLIYAGIDGIQQNMKLEKPANINLYDADTETVKNLRTIPSSLQEAIHSAEESEFIRKCLPYKIVDKFIAAKHDEWQKYILTENKEEFEDNSYFYTV
jgi:glutamine synthetase